MVESARAKENPAFDPVVWNRVAEPQTDHYDSSVCAAIFGIDAPRDRNRNENGQKFGKSIRLINEVPGGTQRLQPAPLDHPNIAKGLHYLNTWQQGCDMVQRLVNRLSIVIDTGSAMDQINGATCGNLGSHVCDIFSTINSPIGFAEALVHETGHAKLKMLGISLTTADHLITNDPEIVYHSPIRYDCLRPMPAVLHAQYSYTCVTALDNAILRSSDDVAFNETLARASLSVVVPKLIFGREVITKHIDTDDNGREFISGFMNWLDRVLAESQQILDSLGVEQTPFRHPLKKEAGVHGPARSIVPRPRQRNDVKFSVKSGEYVLEKNDRQYHLNLPAARIWELCNGQRSIEDIALEIQADLDLPIDSLMSEIEVLTIDLQNKGLLEN